MSKLTDEEIKKLTEIATSGAPEDDTQLHEVDRFIISCGIKEGEAQVFSNVVWLAYCEWAEKPMNRALFYRAFCKRFTRLRKKSWDRSPYYLLNPEPFDLSMDAKFKIYKRLRTLRERRKKRGPNKTI